MRDLRKGICGLCQHNEILESIAGEFGHNDLERPMSVTYDGRFVLSGRNPRHGHGALKMYVCRSCGYTQWFADSPEAIPVGGDRKTRIIRGPESEGTYR